MESPQFLLDWGRVQKLLEEHYGRDVEIAVDATQPQPVAMRPVPQLPPTQLPPPPSAPDSIAPTVMPHGFAVRSQAPRRLGRVVMGAVILSAGILLAAVVRIVIRSEPTASASQVVSVAGALTAGPPAQPPAPLVAAPPPPEVPVVSLEKLPLAKGSKAPTRPAKSKKRH